MIKINNHKQRDLFDPWSSLTPKRRKRLEQSWPGLFRKHLLEELPVEKISPYFTKNFGRPGKELYTLIGILLFQQIMDLSDAETVEQTAFNIQWHYALNITEESDAAEYICEKTCWTRRQVLIEINLDQIIFDKIAGKLACVFNVIADKQRIESTHIKSNMRKLGRHLLQNDSIVFKMP